MNWLWTDRSTFPCPIDLGASWIHGNKKNPLFALARTEHIKMVETEHGVKPATFFTDGKVRVQNYSIRSKKLLRQGCSLPVKQQAVRIILPLTPLIYRESGWQMNWRELIANPEPS